MNSRGTPDGSTGKASSRKQTGRHLLTGFGIPGTGVVFYLSAMHVPWWGLFLWSEFALVVVAIQSVIPQESEHRVRVIRMFFAWLERRSGRSAGTGRARRRRAAVGRNADRGSSHVPAITSSAASAPMRRDT
jgi:hypothetical protein